MCIRDSVKAIHETLNTLLEERKDDPEPIILEKDDVKRLLYDNGAADEAQMCIRDRPHPLRSPAAHLHTQTIQLPKTK